MCAVQWRRQLKLLILLYVLSSYFNIVFSPSDPPEIDVDQSWIRTGDGIEAEVSCNVHAEPKAEVSYFIILVANRSNKSEVKSCNLEVKVPFGNQSIKCDGVSYSWPLTHVGH